MACRRNCFSTRTAAQLLNAVENVLLSIRRTHPATCGSAAIALSQSCGDCKPQEQKEQKEEEEERG